MSQGDGPLKPSKEFMEGVISCLSRADLRPSEPSNTGFSLEHHYRATAAAGEIDVKNWGLPGARETVVSVEPENS